MTAHEAVVARNNIDKLRGELRALAEFIVKDKQFRQAAAAACNDINIDERLQEAVRHLDAYDTILSKALTSTIISEVSLS